MEDGWILTSAFAFNLLQYTLLVKAQYIKEIWSPKDMPLERQGVY